MHAGVLPQWSALADAEALAREVEAALARSDDWIEISQANVRQYTGPLWNDSLQGAERLRCIVNALTRIRFCKPDGSMDLKTVEGMDHAPAGLAYRGSICLTVKTEQTALSSSDIGRHWA